MSVLPPTVLPLVPSVFATGDRITRGACTLERLPVGLWVCTCGPTYVSKTDAQIRELFVAPERLDALGVPMFAPASVSSEAPLPGRPVTGGESPFEGGRPYLMCMTGTTLPAVLAGAPASESGPWGPSQMALIAQAKPVVQSDAIEWSMTATGTVYLRVPATPKTIAVTIAYVPADYPTEDETAALLSYAALSLAFPPLVTVIALS
ncbi:hypothetical protein ACWGH2_41855 [Streptomyces sp. NPDC054871]